MLFLFGIVVIGISSITGTWQVMASTVVGYVFGFILGMVLFADVGSFDPNRGTYRYYGWWVWLLTYIAFIILGIVWAAFRRRKTHVNPNSL